MLDGMVLPLLSSASGPPEQPNRTAPPLDALTTLFVRLIQPASVLLTFSASIDTVGVAARENAITSVPMNMKAIIEVMMRDRGDFRLIFFYCGQEIAPL